MSKHDDDAVGYGRPPKHTRFVKGESGNKGRRKKRPEFQAEMVARIRDERVTVNGVSMTMFELVMRTVRNTTIKSGHPRDLKAFLEILEKYGAIPKGEAAEEMRLAADKVTDTLLEIFEKERGFDPEDSIAIDKFKAEEAAIVMNCPNCSPPLRERWNLPDRHTLRARHGGTGLQGDVEALRKGNG